MKKSVLIFLLISILFSLISCNNTNDSGALEPLDKFDIIQTVNIVLGDEVNSVASITPTGEEITFDNTLDFYEIFNEITFEFEKGKKYSCSAETKIDNRNTYFVNMNAYYLDDAEFYEFRSKKEGNDAIAAYEYYYKPESAISKNESMSFSRYIYGQEIALGGFEYSENGYIPYRSDDYPMIPITYTELADISLSSVYIKDTIQTTEFFKYYQPYEIDNVIYDFNEFVTREYNLYENYIVFKQTAPFLILPPYYMTPYMIAEDFSSFKNSDCSITQEAYYNVKTGEVELIKIFGNTLWHQYQGIELKIDMQVYIHDISESEAIQKVDSLINYVKAKAN